MRQIYTLCRLLFCAIFLFGGLVEVQAQDVSRLTISGKVVDEKQQPMGGVSIIVEGSMRGVISDVDGNFSIGAFARDILSFSFLGYETLQIKASDCPTLVKMQVKANEMDELTVVGFAKQRKESVIGSIVTVTPEDLRIPSSNLTQAFAGNIAGMITQQLSGEPGKDNAAFFIRGVTTFGYSQNPLILIDNIESSADDLARLTPDDIEAFSVMKDATATAIYGARGANGVLLITTKSGREGSMRVNARVEFSLSRPTEFIDMVDPISYMKYHNEAVLTRNPLALRPNSDEKIAATEAGLNPYVYPAVDWYENLFNDFVFNSRANASVSGGGKTARYYVSLGFSDDNGIMKVDKRNNYNTNINYKKLNLRSNININLTKTTEFAIKVTGNFDDYTGPISGGNELYRATMATSPVMFPMYYEPDAAHIHTTHILFGNGSGGSYINPYAEMIKGYRQWDQSLISMQAELSQNFDFITKGLSARFFANTTRKGYKTITRKVEPFYYSVGSYDVATDTYVLEALNKDTGRENLDYANAYQDVTTTYYLEAAINYARTFGEKHDVGGLLVWTMRNYKGTDMSSVQTSLPQRNLGLSGRFTYGYDNRYFVEANFGYNGSERFSENERFGFFPSVGVAWILSNEKFWSDKLKNTLDRVKLKATYGLVGNDAIGSSYDRFYYLSDINLNAGGANYGWGENFGYRPGTIAINRYANPYITWEIARKLNVGAEFTLFNIFDFQVDYFTEKRESIFGARSTIPAEMGFSQNLQANNGKASSKGFEVQLDANHSFNEDWWLGVRGNFTYATGKYDYLEEPFTPYPWLSRVGTNINQPYGFIAERLFIDEEDILNSPTQQFGEYMPGDIKYRDINEDGVINNQDFVPIGISSTPEIVYGFGISVGWKGLDLSCFFQGATRVSFFVNSKATNPFMPMDFGGTFDGRTNINGMMQAVADSYWSETNRNIYATFPRLSTTDIWNNNQASTWWLRDGSYLRLKTLEVGYTLPEKWTSKIHISKLRVYASGINLFSWSRFKMWDVEMGNDGMQYPIQAVYNLGLNINF